MVLGLNFSCEAQKCEPLEENFKSYPSALKAIRAHVFTIKERCDTSKSSWILGAEYYSCNNKKGYLLITTKGKTYIHKDVPAPIWTAFKKADSFGEYYNAHIRNKYQLII